METNLLAHTTPKFIAHIPTPSLIYYQTSKLLGHPIDALLSRFRSIKETTAFWYLLLFFGTLCAIFRNSIHGHRLVIDRFLTLLHLFVEILPEVLDDALESA